ncbi:lactonase family protein [Chitinophaga qingshengii]|uniref:lactonase family protein n=1 Tax=Chitinophaga qingshengii TaxID=1569794 RepID=UPI001FE617E7|nr:lactonase family protein [Chitinophaga qingshengii]
MLCLLVLGYSQWLSAQQYYLFIGSYNKDKNKTGIYIYRFNRATGKSDMTDTIGNVLNPGYLVPSANGSYLYACTEAQTPKAGSVSSYAFNPETGKAVWINSQSSGGDNPVYITEHKSGRWLAVANYTGGSAAVLPVENGHVGKAAQVFAFKDSSLTDRQRSAHIHSAVLDPAHRFLFLPDLGADKIRCFAFDAQLPAPLQPATPPFTATVPGSGPRHFAFHPTLPLAYSIEELSGMVTAYHYANGKLDSLQRIKAHYKRGQDIDYSGADIHVSPDGRFLYASIRAEENIIVIYAIDPATGLLTRIARQSTGGDHPRNFVIDPTGKYLLVANMMSNNVVVFERNAQTGLLKKTGTTLNMPAPSCLQIKAY